jgi:acyl dehydratase
MARPIDVTTLHEHVGEELGISDWLEVTQDRIDRFADATDDRQWIHVDAGRAAVESSFKTTIAHGFLTLSLISVLLRGALSIEGCRMALNYGLNRVRFVVAVPTGSRIRGRFVLSAIEEAAGGSVQVT